MKRLLTAISLLAVALYLLFLSPTWLFTTAAVIMGLLCYREYSDLVKGHGIQRPGVFGVLAGVFLLFSPQQYVLLGITVLVLAAFVTALRAEYLKDILPEVACAFLGAFYTFAPWRFAMILRGVSVHLLFFGLALNWAGDSIAYYAGRRLGKHKLAPVVSPKKSWEGAIAAVCGAVVFGVLYLGHFMPQVALWKVVLIAVMANIGGQMGDLAESAVKRGAGVKDSGNLLPGHGGMLDRVDSSLFALPIVFLLYVVLTNV
jgi:phosphatidate cytidylyltransferase